MAAKRAEYRLTPEAERDLECIWLYSLDLWGLSQANRYIDDIADAFEQLCQQPELGPACDHIRSGYHRLRVGRHIIFFRIADRGITIVRVLHERMDAPRHF